MLMVYFFSKKTVRKTVYLQKCDTLCILIGLGLFDYFYLRYLNEFWLRSHPEFIKSTIYGANNRPFYYSNQFGDCCGFNYSKNNKTAWIVLFNLKMC